MKFIVCRFLLVCVTAGYASCAKPPCECDFIAEQFIEIKLVNQQKQNLVFGPFSIYQTDSIRILQEKNNININNASVRRGLIDSNNVRFDFYTPASKSYIYYKQNQMDSMEIKWIVKTGKCCGNIHQYNFIDSVKFNNTYIKPVDGSYTFVK